MVFIKLVQVFQGEKLSTVCFPTCWWLPGAKSTSPEFAVNFSFKTKVFGNKVHFGKKVIVFQRIMRFYDRKELIRIVSRFVLSFKILLVYYSLINSNRKRFGSNKNPGFSLKKEFARLVLYLI